MTDTKGTFSNGEDEWQNRSLSPEFVGSIPTVSIAQRPRAVQKQTMSCGTEE